MFFRLVFLNFFLNKNNGNIFGLAFLNLRYKNTMSCLVLFYGHVFLFYFLNKNNENIFDLAILKNYFYKNVLRKKIFICFCFQEICLKKISFRNKKEKLYQTAPNIMSF